MDTAGLAAAVVPRLHRRFVHAEVAFEEIELFNARVPMPWIVCPGRHADQGRRVAALAVVVKHFQETRFTD